MLPVFNLSSYVKYERNTCSIMNGLSKGKDLDLRRDQNILSLPPPPPLPRHSPGERHSTRRT